MERVQRKSGEAPPYNLVLLLLSCNFPCKRCVRRCPSSSPSSSETSFQTISSPPPLSSLGRASRAELMRVREIAKAGNKVRRGETTACPVALLVDPKSCQVPHHWSVHERVPGNGYMIWQPWRGGDGNFSPLHSEVGG